MASKADLLQPANGSYSWDVPLNANFQTVTNALGAITSKSLTSSNVQLTTDEAAAMALSFSGTLLTDISVFVPAATIGSWIVNNIATMGGYKITLYVDAGGGTPAGTGVELTTTNARTFVVSDGTNVAIASDYFAPGTITTAFIADSAVTTDKLADGSVTAPKLAANAVETAKILDANVTSAKLADGAATTAKINDGAVTAAKMSGAQTGNPPAYAVRAWAFVTVSGGVATLTAGGNIASVTRSGTGTLVFTFTTAMPNANYSVTAVPYFATTGIAQWASVYAKTTTGFTTGSRWSDGSNGGASRDVSMSIMVVG